MSSPFGCVICHKLVLKTEERRKENLQDIFRVFCQHMDWLPQLFAGGLDMNLPDCNNFSFCQMCEDVVERIYDYDTHIRQLQEEIRKLTCQVNAKLLLAERPRWPGQFGGHGNGGYGSDAVDEIEIPPANLAEMENCRTLASSRFLPNVICTRLSPTSIEHDESTNNLMKPDNELLVERVSVQCHVFESDEFPLSISSPGTGIEDDSLQFSPERDQEEDLQSEETDPLYVPPVQSSTSTEMENFCQPTKLVSGYRKRPLFYNRQKNDWRTEIQQLEENRFQYQNHVFEHVEGKFKCSTCSKLFPRPSEILRHIKTHIAGGRPVFNSRSKPGQEWKKDVVVNSLDENRFQYEDFIFDLVDNQYKCATCHFVCPTRPRVISHIRKVHIEGNSLRCHFKSVQNSENQFTYAGKCRYEKSENKFKCLQIGCCYSCLTAATIRQHMMDKHLEEAKRFDCSVCGEKFTKPGYLKLHMIKHTDERPAMCNICGKTYKRKVNLRAHLELAHVRGKTHMCEFCGKKFYTKQYLRDHLTIHTGKVTAGVICEVCGVEIPRVRLHHHMQKHWGKIFECDECDSKFTNAFRLKVHKRKHEGRKFECTLCGAGYRDPSSLSRHVRLKQCSGKRRNRVVHFRPKKVTTGDTTQSNTSHCDDNVVQQNLSTNVPHPTNSDPVMS